MRETKRDKAAFREAMDELRDSYTFPVEEAEWVRRLRVYWKQLKRFDLEEVQEACESAPAKYPSRMPTAGQLVGLVLGLQSERAERYRQRIATEAEERENEAAREYFRRVPNNPEGAREWIAEGRTCLDRLGRIWACQDKSRNRDGTQATPQNIGMPRLREMFALMDKHSEEKCPCFAKSTGSHPTASA